MIVRAARMADAAGMAAVLNEIIAIGGTTAHATPKSAGQLRLGYIDGPEDIGRGRGSGTRHWLAVGGVRRTSALSSSQAFKPRESEPHFSG